MATTPHNTKKPIPLATIRDIVMGLLMIVFGVAVLFVTDIKAKASAAFFSEKWINVFGALILIYGLWRLIKGLFLNKKYDKSHG